MDEDTQDRTEQDGPVSDQPVNEPPGYDDNDDWQITGTSHTGFTDFDNFFVLFVLRGFYFSSLFIKISLFNN